MITDKKAAIAKFRAQYGTVRGATVVEWRAARAEQKERKKFWESVAKAILAMPHVDGPSRAKAKAKKGKAKAAARKAKAKKAAAKK